MKSACLSILFLVILFHSSSFMPESSHYTLVGIWESEEKDLQIEMYESDGAFSGRMIYFKCATDEIMRTCKDTENPDNNLIHRKLLGLTLVTRLIYQGDNIWDDGKIYDPNSGHTFEARIQMISPRAAIVRGYWKYRWIGRSLAFHRKN
jgi:uncharacterized protein (DUF2147 family)